MLKKKSRKPQSRFPGLGVLVARDGENVPDRWVCSLSGNCSPDLAHNFLVGASQPRQKNRQFSLCVSRYRNRSESADNTSDVFPEMISR